MLKINFTGNLGRDAETKTMQDGTLQIRFSVGVSQGRERKRCGLAALITETQTKGPRLLSTSRKVKAF
jgi:single-stranded DNA-binding protein